MVIIRLNGRPLPVRRGSNLAAALLSAGQIVFRRDSSGRPRAPFCGIGSCYECRLTVDGVVNTRSCLVSVEEGMTVETDE